MNDFYVMNLLGVGNQMNHYLWLTLSGLVVAAVSGLVGYLIKWKF